MAAPLRKSILFQPHPLDTRYLIEVVDLLRRQGYSGVDYYDLGISLGLSPDTLDDIKEKDKGNARLCLIECLRAWLEQKDNVKSKGVPTYEILIQTLREIGQNDVADGLERYFQVPPITPKPISTEDSPAANRIADTQNPLTEDAPEYIILKDHLADIVNLLAGNAPVITQFSNHLFSSSLVPKEVHLNPRSSPLDRATQLINSVLSTIVTHSNPSSVFHGLVTSLEKVGLTEMAKKLQQSLGDIVPPAADRIPDTQNPLTESNIKKWLKEGKVELEITRINMHGAPGAGKTCSKCLLLNEPPPEKLTDSTAIACRAAKATRISANSKNKWETVDESEMLNQLASDLKKAPIETKQERTPTRINEAQLSMAAPDHASAPKPLLEEQTKHKPTDKKPFNIEVFKDISDALETGNAKSLSRNWVYFIDSGGQPAYRELLPLFTRAASLNIITIDLTKGLDDEKCEYHYRISEHTSPINTDLKYSNRDIICSAISSEAMLNPIEIPYLSASGSKKPKPPHYLILGTRKELVDHSEEKLEEMNKSLMSLDLKNVIQKELGKSIIFPVNTLLPAGSKEREEASGELCTAISNCNLEMTIELPIRLFAFEISLQREAKNKKRSFLTREEVIEIGRSLRLDDESDIDEALQFLHNFTILLYYPAVLPNIIFVDPEPILDVLSRLIAITYVQQSKLDLIAKASNSERLHLKECGLFEEDLLKKIGQRQKIFDQDFESSHMIKLLKHLHIIAEVKNKKEKEDDYHHIVTDTENKKKIEYFFPCALPSYDKLKAPSTEIRPLLIAWEINNSGTICTKSLAIPQGLFPLTIVHLLEREDVDFNERFYRCLDAMSLCVNDEYTINIINRYTHIEIRFYDEKKYCAEIRKLVEDAIKNSGNDLKVSKKYTLVFAFKCPENEQSYCIVKEDNSSTRCKCQPQCKVLQGDDDNSYRCWFSDCQSSSPGTKASSEDPPTKSTSDRFRRISDRLAGSISSCLTTVSGKLNARSLIARELHDEMITGHDIDSKKAPKLVNAIQTNLNSHSSPEAYLNEVCSALKDVGEKQIIDIVNELEQSETD